MRFELAEAATLDDVRFDGLALALATTDGYYHVSRARLHIEITNSDHGEEPIHSYTMLLKDVENSTVAFILQLLEEHPEYMELPCPNIWVNGRGEAHEATWNTASGSPGMVVNQNANVSQTITQQLAQELGQKYREKMEKMEKQHESEESDESDESDGSEELEGLESVLASLCYRYYYG
jgi:hypothetical protein